MRLAKTVLVLFFLSLFGLLSLLVAEKAKAQIPPPYVPCDEIDKPEFHSLRPYQASPCDTEVHDTALFCGNDLELKDEITVNKSQAVSCEEVSLVKEVCTFLETKTTTIAIDMSDAELPIAGYTEEEVVNSQTQPEPEGFSHPTKVNEYISWYLEGVVNRAEYPYPNVSVPERLRELIDLSGPINKLFPWDLQALTRIQTIDEAGDTRHNQVVGCTLDFLGFLFQNPFPCYEDASFGFQVDERRLSDWDDLKPPLVYNEEGEKVYDDFNEYYADLKRWRGEFCWEVPDWIPIIGGALLCGDNPFKPNFWAELFPYIPYSSTEDRLGEADVDSAKVKSGSPDVKVISYSLNTEPADLFFAHMQENVETADILQSAYVAQGEERTNAASYIHRPNETCELVQVRSNPGDDLFAGEILIDPLTYTVEFTCDFPIEKGQSCFQPSDCPVDQTCGVDGFCTIEESDPSCTKEVRILLETVTKTPEADNLWQRLVDGPQSVFKRIFPKLGEGGPIEAFLDIPGATKVTYESDALVSVTNPTGRSEIELYFPHLGGIHEYFLKGIQTILRPKGYGEQILSGQPPPEDGEVIACGNGEIGDIPDLPPASGACRLSTTGPYRSIPDLPPTMIEILEGAATTYRVPPSVILAVLFGEGAFDRSWVWTEENVVAWSKACAIMPDCDPTSSSSQGPYQIFQSEWDAHKDAVQAIDPEREPQRCNFLDETFAVAKKLGAEAWGWSGYPPPQSCMGVSFNLGTGGPTSCAWDPMDVATGFRQWEGTCFSTPGSCAGGAPTGDCPGDTCEQYSACFGGGAACSSHTYCLWDVYQYYK